MQYVSEIGKIYDSILFCVEYFNETFSRESILDNNTKDYYREIKTNISSLPLILSPFFFHHDDSPTALSLFFEEQIDFNRDNINTFLKKITTASNILFAKIVDVIFLDQENSDNQKIAISPLIAPETYIKALFDSDYTDNFKLQVALLFGNFNYAVSVLVDTLRTVFAQVNCLYLKYNDMIFFVFEQVRSERNVELYQKVYAIDILSTEKPVAIALSMFSPHMIKFDLHDNHFQAFLGIKHEEQLSLYYDKNNIDLRQLLIAVGNDIRLSIIDSLQESGELTVAALSKKLKIPPTTVLRHVEILHNSGVLFITRKSGLQIFYQLNRDLCLKATNLINNKYGGKSQ